MIFLTHIARIAADLFGANYDPVRHTKPSPFDQKPPAPREPSAPKTDFEWYGGQRFEFIKDVNGTEWEVNASLGNPNGSGRRPGLSDADRAAFRGAKWDVKKAAAIKEKWAKGLSVGQIVASFNGAFGYRERTIKEYVAAFNRAAEE